MENNGDGTVTDIARENGTKGEFVNGNFGHTIGSVFGDIDNDGDFDLIQANLAHPFYYWFSNKSKILIQENGNFLDESSERGMYYRETHSNPTLFDADNDGDLDLFVTSVYAVRDSDFYLNDGSGHFTLSNYESGLVVKMVGVHLCLIMTKMGMLISSHDSFSTTREMWKPTKIG